MIFILACAEFGTSFIAKAQAEIDSVVGSDRLPTFDDLPDLPFVRAIMNETLRWRPIAVLGVRCLHVTLKSACSHFFYRPGYTAC